MKYCFVLEKEVYSCDHYECNNTDSKYGTEISSMTWCVVFGTHVYSCGHYECR